MNVDGYCVPGSVRECRFNMRPFYIHPRLVWFWAGEVEVHEVLGGRGLD